MAAKISNWLGTRSQRSHLSAALTTTANVQVRGEPGGQEQGVVTRQAAFVLDVVLALTEHRYY